jgi:RimJ/RimL family protein N-acetyltransferase
LQLQTPRLILREYEPEDWRAVLQYHADERYWRFYEPRAADEAAAREFVARFVDWQREAPRRRFQLAVVLRETGRLIGSCGLRQRPQLDFGHAEPSEGDIGYEVDADLWGRGYASEAAEAMLRFGFDELGLHRVWSFCLAENQASARVLEKLGMRLEGRLVRQERMRGAWWDALVYAILEEEWRTRGVR